MRVGLFLPSVSPIATPEFLTAYGNAAEEAGFDSIWIGEHVVLFDDYASSYPYAQDGRIPARAGNGMLEMFTTLSFLAATTSTIRLGTGICLVPQRNPVYTAKSVATVDWLSGGRVDFGVGIGWLREEFDALNEPFEERAPRTREYVEVIRRLWHDDVSSFKGKYYDLPSCRMDPKPVQDGGPPLYFGGESDPALRRVADLGDGWLGFNHTPDSAAEHIHRLDALLGERSRALSDVDITVCSYMQPADPSMLPAYRDAGVEQLVLTGFAASPSQAHEVIAAMGDAWVGAAKKL